MDGSGNVYIANSQADNDIGIGNVLKEDFAYASRLSAPLAKQTYPEAAFAVSTSSDSTGAITYSVISGPAKISGDVVTLTGTGTVELKASLAAAGDYAAATATTSFSVER